MRPLLPSILLTLALSAGVGAEHCTTYSTADPEVDTDPADLPGVPRYYYDLDLCGVQDCMFSMWIYEETNGIPGLQRGDEWHDGTCHSMVEADTIVF